MSLAGSAALRCAHPMTISRAQHVDLAATPYYHLASRCVRRAFLCGRDAHSGRDYEHRKGWLAERPRELGEIVAVEVCAYAVMSNHDHLVLIERGGLDLHLTYDADDHVVAIDEAVSGDRAEIDFDAMERRTGRRTLVGAALVAAVAFQTAPSHVQALESPHVVTDASTGAATTGYVYDGEHALARYDASTGDEVYYLRDAMGSVIGLVDGAGTGASTISTGSQFLAKGVSRRGRSLACYRVRSRSIASRS